MKGEYLLSGFSDKYLKNKKNRRYLLIGIIILVILIIIILIIAFSGKSDEESNGKSNKESDNISGPCPEIKYVNGGLSGSGFASRYWDCCKPSCSWTENAGSGNEARQCDASMNILTDKNTKSKCDGGPATTCLSEKGFTINGCDNLGFAFAAVPGRGLKFVEDAFCLNLQVKENMKPKRIIDC